MRSPTDAGSPPAMASHSTLFVEQLTNLDFAYLDPARGLVGETLLLDLTLTGDLDAQGMVLDFGRVKREVRDAAEALVDHKLIVPMHCPAVDVQTDDGVWRVILSLAGGGTVEIMSPAQAICPLDTASCTEEAMGMAIRASLTDVVPANVAQVGVVLAPEAIDGAAYHYCHGLRKHDGDCQRIAHGHRSRIRIDADGVRDAQLEAAWARRWWDRFLATEADALTPTRAGHRRFGYDAPQGRFEIELPAERVDVLPTDTTVECLATFIARTLADETGRRVDVRAYEGVRKGAMASA